MSDFHRDYYRVFRVSKDASLPEIRLAYWDLARRIRWNVQEQDAEARLEEIQCSYERFNKDEHRHDYDIRGNVRLSAVTSDHRDSWHSDEIAVDFPSMDSIIQRMREGFFGSFNSPVSWTDETQSTHTVDIELTARQADEGVCVPLNLPIRHTCPMCSGRGELWNKPCRVCDSTGGGLLSHRLQLKVPPRVRHGTRLSFSVSPSYAAETHIEVRIAIQ